MHEFKNTSAPAPILHGPDSRILNPNSKPLDTHPLDYGAQLTRRSLDRVPACFTVFHGRPAIESKLTNGKTQTGNDEKRLRDFQLTISQDGESLVGTIIDSSDINNREKRLDVIWNRVRD